jgi:hypothetical protein
MDRALQLDPKLDAARDQLREIARLAAGDKPHDNDSVLAASPEAAPQPRTPKGAQPSTGASTPAPTRRVVAGAPSYSAQPQQPAPTRQPVPATPQTAARVPVTKAQPSPSAAPAQHVPAFQNAPPMSGQDTYQPRVPPASADRPGDLPPTQPIGTSGSSSSLNHEQRSQVRGHTVTRTAQPAQPISMHMQATHPIQRETRTTGPGTAGYGPMRSSPLPTVKGTGFVDPQTDASDHGNPDEWWGDMQGSLDGIMDSDG